MSFSQNDKNYALQLQIDAICIRLDHIEANYQTKSIFNHGHRFGSRPDPRFYLQVICNKCGANNSGNCTCRELGTFETIMRADAENKGSSFSFANK